jgi:hypothetical protein
VSIANDDDRFLYFYYSCVNWLSGAHHQTAFGQHGRDATIQEGIKSPARTNSVVGHNVLVGDLGPGEWGVQQCVCCGAGGVAEYSSKHRKKALGTTPQGFYE